MRKVVVLLLAIALLSIAYFGSIAISVQKLVEASKSGNAAEIVARTDFARLRGSITRQILDAYLEKNGRDKKPINLMLVNTYGASVVDAMLSKFLTPDNLTKLLQTGSATDASQGTVWEIPSLDGLSLSRTLDLIGRLRPIQIKEVEIRTSASDAADAYSAVSFHLDGMTWKLSGIRLPNSLVEKLAGSLPKR